MNKIQIITVRLLKIEGILTQGGNRKYIKMLEEYIELIEPLKQKEPHLYEIYNLMKHDYFKKENK